MLKTLSHIKRVICWNDQRQIILYIKIYYFLKLCRSHLFDFFNPCEMHNFFSLLRNFVCHYKIIVYCISLWIFMLCVFFMTSSSFHTLQPQLGIKVHTHTHPAKKIFRVIRYYTCLVWSGRKQVGRSNKLAYEICEFHKKLRLVTRVILEGLRQNR